MPYHLSDGSQQAIVFEDETRDQSVCIELTNVFKNRMKFAWQTSIGQILSVVPETGVMGPGEKKFFDIHFHGNALLNTEVMDTDHSIKMWWSPFETRKRQIDNTELEVPIYFAVHVRPKSPIF